MVIFANDIKYVKDIKGVTDKNGAKNGTCERSLTTVPCYPWAV